MTKILLFFSNLFHILWVILHDKTGQPRSQVLLCVEISWRGDELAVSALHPSCLLGRCPLRNFVVLFSPVTGV